ncbi:MAG: VOC family protein [Myxococcales bacterium]|nr:VOC family protein [Myxococcales bacterium]MCB9641770.1 VOC family protein [Myxococcales bacterium]
MTPTIHHVGLVSFNLAHTTAFYCALFDAQPLHQNGHTLVPIGPCMLAISPKKPEDPENYAWGHHLALSWPASPKDALLQKLQDLQAPCQEVQGRLYVKDPDGFTLEFLWNLLEN